MNLEDCRAGPMDLSLRALIVGTSKLVQKIWDIGSKHKDLGPRSLKVTRQTAMLVSLRLTMNELKKKKKDIEAKHNCQCKICYGGSIDIQEANRSPSSPNSQLILPIADPYRKRAGTTEMSNNIEYKMVRVFGTEKQ